MSAKKISLLQGNEACVRGAIAAGMRFYAGYPITPSTEIAENSARMLPTVGGKFIQMEDEIGGIAAAIGASIAGLKAMTATSGPGFSLKQENLGLAVMTETPLVVVDVQRCGPSSGIATAPAQGDVMQARWGTHGDHPVIALSPSSVRECFDLTVCAFNLAEKYRTPVILLMDEVVAHMREGVEIPEAAALDIVNRKLPSAGKENFKPVRIEPGQYVPDIPPLGQGYRFNTTSLAHDETGFPVNSTKVCEKLVTRLMQKVDNNKADIVTYEEYRLEDAEIAVVCYGATARSVMEAVDIARENGIRVGVFRPITIWPFPEEQIKALGEKVNAIIVAEHNYGQIVLEVERIVKNDCRVSLLAKVGGDFITPAQVAAAIKEAK